MRNGRPVVLVNPPRYKGFYVNREENCENFTTAKINPYTLASIGGVLRGRYNVMALDAQIESLDIRKSIELIREMRPHFIILLMSTYAIKSDRQLGEELSTSYPVIASILPSSTDPLEAIGMYDLQIPFFTKGELEHTILSAISEYTRHRRIKETKGIIVNLKRKVKETGHPYFPNLESLPMPAHDLLPFHKYEEPIRLMTARGCPFRCVYCSQSNIPYRHRSANQVVKEIEFLSNKYECQEFYIFENEFSLNKERAKNICKEMISRNLHAKWKTLDRVDLVDEDLLRFMKIAGCHSIGYGIESPSTRVQKEIRKGLSRQSIIKAFNLARSHGISTTAFWMVGLPGEDEKTKEECVRLFKECKPDNFAVTICYPAPGTELASSLKKRGRMLDEDWDNYKSFSYGTGKSMIYEHDHYKSISELNAMYFYLWKEFSRIQGTLIRRFLSNLHNRANLLLRIKQLINYLRS